MSLSERIEDWKKYPNALGSESQVAVIVGEVAAVLGEPIPGSVKSALRSLSLRGRMRDIASSLQGNDQLGSVLRNLGDVVDADAASRGMSWAEGLAVIATHLEKFKGRVVPQGDTAAVNSTLGETPEDMPPWLLNFNKGDKFDRRQFFRSRIIYYPGSGTDGGPVRVYGSMYSAHCFVYVDYGKTQSELEAALMHPEHGFLGYNRFDRVQLTRRDLDPGKLVQHVRPSGTAHHPHQVINPTNAFGFLEVLERKIEFNDGHGPRRLAILFIGADGIAAYDALFCQEGTSPRFAIVLHDGHGNYDSFGRGGLLEEIAVSCNIFPQWLLVKGDTHPWNGFARVPEVGERGSEGHGPFRFSHWKQVE